MKLNFELNADQFQDLVNISSGLFKPLDGFMGSADYRAVVERMELADGSVWTLPVTLDVDAETFKRAAGADRVWLRHQGEEVGRLEIEDCYVVDREADAERVYQTASREHPGVNKELNRSEHRIGGRTALAKPELLLGGLDPARLREQFRQNGWRTVVGFQTRNPIHRAHEHLQRIGLEVCDGLFINPLVGWKAAGEFSEKAVLAAYQVMVKSYFPPSRVHLEGLRTPMRYGGPREAIFHALIRRNTGCTHFIIGRDHAGVGDFYGRYEAHELAGELMRKKDLGISLLLLKEPYYCFRCEQVVTEKTCAHSGADRMEISGTLIRKLLRKGLMPDGQVMRKPVVEAILALGKEMFIKRGDT